MTGSCWCGGNADACSDADEHTGPGARVDDEPEPPPYAFGRCATCRQDRAISRVDRVCDGCRSAANRAYFASPEAAATFAAAMGVAPVAERDELDRAVFDLGPLPEAPGCSVCRRARETSDHLCRACRACRDESDAASIIAARGRDVRYVPVPSNDPIVAVAIEEMDAAPSAPTIDHASYLGASDMGAILDLDPMRTPLDVWAEKTRRVTFDSSLELEAGNDHEGAVVAGAARRLRRLGLAERVDYPGPGTIRNGWIYTGTEHAGGTERFDWRGATLDAVVHHRDHGPCPLEAKLVGSGMAGAWGPEPAGAVGLPDRTLVQVHWQALHARERFGWRCPVAYVAADIAGTDRRLYEVPVDDELIADLLAAGRAWWTRHVIGDEMPEPSARDNETLSRIYPSARLPLSPITPATVRELAEDYVIAREIAQRHANEVHRIAALLRAEIGEREGYRWRGGKVTWSEAANGSRRLNVKIWEAA